MSLEKVLHKIQSQINNLTPTLELFVDETIQPSVDECEKLQQQLNLIQENLAVYKYNKVNKEISPSFSIHSKVSEKEVPKEIIEDITFGIKEVVLEKTTEPEISVIETRKEENTEVKKTIQPFVIGINDKFRFINELFKQNGSEYNIAMEQLNALGNWSETEIYLNSLRTLYNWKENSDVVNYFFSIAKKRFS